jgi:hypothetical protein
MQEEFVLLLQSSDASEGTVSLSQSDPGEAAVLLRFSADSAASTSYTVYVHGQRDTGDDAAADYNVTLSVIYSGDSKHTGLTFQDLSLNATNRPYQQSYIQASEGAVATISVEVDGEYVSEDGDGVVVSASLINKPSVSTPLPERNPRTHWECIAGNGYLRHSCHRCD